tara:strand:- start:402 stop:617 length:216 start_codon:yes stop_codon:yes gene_type:complete
MKVNDKVWVLQSDIDNDCYVAGKVVGFTSKRIKVLNLTRDDCYKNESNAIGNYKANSVKLRDETLDCDTNK